jgi:RNA polymerase-binding transcription factor DksA
MGNALHTQCRATLQSERADLLQSIDDLTHGEASREEEDETAIMADKLRDTLRDVEAALAKLTNGTYGTCELCKGKIADEHLVDMPMSRHCTDCGSARSSVISTNRDVE